MSWQSWPVPPPHSQQTPPDLDPSGEEQEEDYDTGQHLGLATKVEEGDEYVLTFLEQEVEGMVEGQELESLEEKGLGVDHQVEERHCGAQ